MKVNIGPYPKSSKTERRVNVHIDDYDVWSMYETLALIILPMLKKLKKIKYGAPNTRDEDVPVKLRSTSAPKKKNDWDTDANFFKRWDWIIDEMIWTFEQYNSDWENKFHSGKMDMLWQALDKDNKKIGKPIKLGDKTKPEGLAYWQMVKGPKDTHKFDRKGYEKHQARITNGLRLFGVYFQSLWH